MQRLWHYYARNRDERGGPIPEDDVRALLGRGHLLPDDLIWAEGMPNWVPASTLQTSTGPSAAVMTNPPPPVPPATDKNGARVPENLKGWLRFVGVMSILSGTLYCFSCVGILWGVLLIIGGVALLGARSALDTLPTMPSAWWPFLDKLNTFFMVTGIAYIIMLLGSLLVLIFYGSILIAMLSSAAF